MQQRRGRWQQVVVGGAIAWATGAGAAQLYVGLPSGRTQAYARDGAGWARVARFDPPDVGNGAAPAFGDLDGDGDLDALIGNSSGQLQAFENTGTTEWPIWARRADWDPPSPSSGMVAPVLVDLDGDDDPDLLVGTGDGNLRAYQHASSGTLWTRRSGWDVVNVGNEPRPAVGDVNRDGRLDLLVGLADGHLAAFAGTGSSAVPFVRRADWDPPQQVQRIAPALGDLDGDGAIDLLLGDGNAAMTVLRNGGSAWEAHPDWAPADPGSGPAIPVLIAATFASSPPPPPPPPPSATPTAALSAKPTRGRAPLTVAFDASASTDPNGDVLQFAWDFGDGTPSAAADTRAAVADPGAAIKAAAQAYNAAKNTRDAGHFPEAVTQYLAVVSGLLPLVDVTIDGPVSAKGVKQIGRVARWYLQKIGHDLGGVYLWHSLGLSSCDRYGTSLQYSRESATQAVAGGWGGLPAINGTDWNIDKATSKLQSAGCPIPAPASMFGDGRSAGGGGGGDGGSSGGSGAGPGTSDATGLASHTYVVPGRYTATVTVSDGKNTAQDTVTIVVNDPSDPTPPDDGGSGSGGGTTVDPTNDPYEGFGATTPGGTGYPVIHITEATDAAVRTAFKQAADGKAIISFDVAGPIDILSPLPRLEGAFVTVEGNGATLVGTSITRTAAMVDVRGHDVIVRNLRLRNGGDNLRAQGTGAYNVVFSHLSSTGSGDDGISIGYGAHDITVQYCFLAGDTRSIFMKYDSTTRVSLHHNWLMKQWIRGPLVSTNVMADIRNIIVEDWAMWGTRFEANASGNVVNSLFTLGKYARSIGGKGDSALRLIQDGPVYTAGNVVAGLAVDPADGSAAAPLDAPPVTTMSVADMTDFVHAHAGVLPRDAVDQAYIDTGDGWHIGRLEPFRINP